MSAIEDSQVRPLQSEVDDGQDPLLSEFQRLKREIIEAERERNGWRKEADTCFDYVAGHQWSDEDKTELAEQHRPAITFNRTAPLVKAVCGLEVNNRQGIIYLPRQVGQSGVNEMITAPANGCATSVMLKMRSQKPSATSPSAVKVGPKHAWTMMKILKVKFSRNVSILVKWALTKVRAVLTM
jgi:hypothetical protein